MPKSVDPEPKEHEPSRIRRGLNNDAMESEVNADTGQNGKVAATIEIKEDPGDQEDVEMKQVSDVAATLIYFKDVEGKIPDIGNDDDFYDMNECWKWLASDYDELDLCEPESGL